MNDNRVVIVEEQIKIYKKLYMLIKIIYFWFLFEADSWVSNLVCLSLKALPIISLLNTNKIN